jgi:hypothetical protein
MHIKVANTGRRPILILSLVKTAGKIKWYRTLHNPMTDKKVLITNNNLEEFMDGNLAHNAAKKLHEGEVIEYVFLPEDCDEFMHTHINPPIQAKRLQIEDITGKLHNIKNSSTAIQELMKAWNP